MFENKFDEAAFKERLFFRTLNNLYNLFPEEKYLIQELYYNDTSRYDILVSTKEAPYKRFIIEIKIRKDKYPEYVYENSKHKALKIAYNVDPENNTILYINSTPDGTYIWNIMKIIDKYKLTHKQMNSQTVISTTDKEDKKTYLLKPEDAFRKYDYKWDEQQFNNLQIEKFKESKKIKKALFDINIFNDVVEKKLKDI